ncbi:MAG TPA: MerR family transcriptional regulator [Thermoanaerobaculia bacterium]|nr:MerR family transcriptional regulator [Thermoanaerobaculia bacterium]
MAEEKGAKAMFKIGEVCRLADVQPYVLRYWETEFPSLAPAKGGGGQRTYTQREVDIVLRIKTLLYTDGFTIAGAKKKLEAESSEPEFVASDAPPAATPTWKAKRVATATPSGALEKAKSELQAILQLLQ